MIPYFVRVADIATTSKKRGILPVSPATIWRWVQEGKFPKPVKLGRSTVWSMQDINAFIARCAPEAA